MTGGDRGSDVRRVAARMEGRVQGVFFRVSTREAAEDLGIAGTVRNEPDGSVAVLAQGPRDSMEAFLAWLRKGPPHARVDRLEVRDEEPGPLEGFRIVG